MTRERMRRLIELREQRRSMIVDRIARDFVVVLREGETDQTWAEMRRRNVELIGTGACASHDFCDANMVMSDAFERHMGHTADGDSERDASIWSDAWRLAQRRDLTEIDEADFDVIPHDPVTMGRRSKS